MNTYSRLRDSVVGRSGLVLFLCAGAAGAAWAAPTIRVDSISAKANASADLPILFTADSPSVATGQFDLMLPKGITTQTVKAGSAASKAGKSVQSSPVPGGLRLLVFGVNQNTIETGTLATVRIKTSAGAASQPIRLQSVVASAPTASPVSVKTVDGSLKVTGAQAKTPS
jgi:hypothetical protein